MVLKGGFIKCEEIICNEPALFKMPWFSVKERVLERNAIVKLFSADKMVLIEVRGIRRVILCVLPVFL